MDADTYAALFDEYGCDLQQRTVGLLKAMNIKPGDLLPKDLLEASRLVQALGLMPSFQLFNAAQQRKREQAQAEHNKQLADAELHAPAEASAPTRVTVATPTGEGFKQEDVNAAWDSFYKRYKNRYDHKEKLNKASFMAAWKIAKPFGEKLDAAVEALNKHAGTSGELTCRRAIAASAEWEGA